MSIQGLAMEVSEEGLAPEQRQTLKAIRQRKTEVVAVHRSKKAVTNNQAVLPRGADRDRMSNTTNMRVSCISGNSVWHHSKLASKGGIFTTCTQVAKGTSWSSAPAHQAAFRRQVYEQLLAAMIREYARTELGVGAGPCLHVIAETMPSA